MNATDRRRSLQILERDHWPDQAEYPSPMVQRCHALRKFPVGELTVEDLRLLIGQDIGLPFLMPLALEIVRKDPLAEGDLYPGDLLRNMLHAPDSYWVDHPDQRSELQELARPVLHALPK